MQLQASSVAGAADSCKGSWDIGTLRGTGALRVGYVVGHLCRLFFRGCLRVVL